jgi:hypothetical protein
MFTRGHEDDTAPVKAIIEREFGRKDPQIAGASPVLFERDGAGRVTRVWFLSRFPHRLLGWDGKIWIERDPNAGNPSRDARDRRYFRGELDGHGARGYFSVNLQVGQTLLFPATDGITAYDTRQGTWSHQLMSGNDPANGMPIVPELMAIDQGKSAIALVGKSDPALWKFQANKWTKLSAPWPVVPAPPRRVVLTRRGVWVHADKLLTFYTFDGRPPANFGKLIEALASDSFQRRDDAQRALVALGINARPWLEQARKDATDNVEAALRIDAVLRTLKQSATPRVGTVPVDFIDGVSAIDGRYAVVTAHDFKGPGGNIRHRLLISDEEGRFTELDASLGNGLEVAYGLLSRCAETRVPGRYWIPRAGEGGRAALVDFKAQKVLDTLPNPHYMWVQAVTEKGIVYASPTGPSELPTSKPVMVYQPGLTDDVAALPVTSVEISSDAYCVASDGAIWAALTSGGVSRFDAKGWNPVAELAGMKDVIGFSPGAHGEMLVESRGGAALLLPGHASIRATTAEAIVKNNRDVVAAAFPWGQCGRPSHDMAALFSDPAGNVWFKRGGPWGVMTSGGWQDGTKAVSAAAKKSYRFQNFEPIGDASRVIISEGNYPKGFTFLVRVEKGKLVFETIRHVFHTSPLGRLVRDRDGNIYLPGDPVCRVTPDAIPEEVTGLPIGADPQFSDADGDVWFSNRRYRSSNELSIWRDGKVLQTISFPGLGNSMSLKADRPGSVWAWNVTGVHHLVAKDGKYALAKSYQLENTGGMGQHVEYTPLGYLAGASYHEERGIADRYYRLDLIRLPK